MMWWGPWSGMPLWPILMLLMMVGCVAMMVMMMRGHSMQPPWHSSGNGKTARDILDARYARGEIGRDEYEAKRRDLAA